MYRHYIYLSWDQIYIPKLHQILDQIYIPTLHLSWDKIYIPTLYLSWDQIYISSLHLSWDQIYIPKLHLSWDQIYIPTLHLSWDQIYIPTLNLRLEQIYIPTLHLIWDQIYIPILKLNWDHICIPHFNWDSEPSWENLTDLFIYKITTLILKPKIIKKKKKNPTVLFGTTLNRYSRKCYFFCLFFFTDPIKGMKATNILKFHLKYFHRIMSKNILFRINWRLRFFWRINAVLHTKIMFFKLIVLFLYYTLTD